MNNVVAIEAGIQGFRRSVFFKYMCAVFFEILESRVVVEITEAEGLILIQHRAGPVNRIVNNNVVVTNPAAELLELVHDLEDEEVGRGKEGRIALTNAAPEIRDLDLGGNVEEGIAIALEVFKVASPVPGFEVDLSWHWMISHAGSLDQ